MNERNSIIGVAPMNRGRAIDNTSQSVLYVMDSSISKAIHVNILTQIINIGITPWYSVDKSSVTGIYSNTINGQIPSNVRVENVVISGFNYGIDAILYGSTFKNVIARQCNYGFYIHKSTTAEMTSILMNSCYAESCTYQGFYLEGLIYSSMICCAADSTGTDGTALQGGEGYAYNISRCKNLSMVNCGCESNKKALYCNRNLNCNFDLYILSTMAIIGDSLGEFIYMLNPMLCTFNIDVEIRNYSTGKICYYEVFSSGSPNKLISNTLTEDNINYAYETASSVPYVVRQTLELNNSCNSVRGNGATRPSKSPINVGYMFFDETLGKPIWYKGKVNNADVWVDATGATV